MKTRDFNPRSPYGERPPYYGACGFRVEFQSTLPLRGATRKAAAEQCNGYHISIHAPLTGSDRAICGQLIHSVDFNPRSPYGERRCAI